GGRGEVSATGVPAPGWLGAPEGAVTLVGGSVSERPKVRHSKCRVVKATVGSNPTATARVGPGPPRDPGPGRWPRGARCTQGSPAARVGPGARRGQGPGRPPGGARCSRGAPVRVSRARGSQRE